MARLLFLASPELRGADVLRVQQLLRARACRPGALDGAYGPATAAAVRRFQRARGLDVDGIVGPHTLAELGHEATSTPKAPLPGREPPGELALAWMIEREGMRDGRYGNGAKWDCAITREFRLRGPWCMETVSLAFKHGAGVILGDDASPPWAFWPDRGFAYVPAFCAWAIARGYWHGRTQPQRGDVVAYSWGTSLAQHVGICRADLGGGVFNAEEGNTSAANAADGGELTVRRRYVHELYGVARITRTRP